MALEPYRSDVVARLTPLSDISADAAGAAIGRGMEEFGQGLEAFDLARRRADRQQQMIDGQLAWLQAESDIDQAQRDDEAGKVDGAPASGAGRAQRVLKSFDDRMQGVLGGVGDRQVRADLALKIAASRQRRAGQLAASELASGADYAGQQYQQTLNMAANRIAQTDDPVEVSANIANTLDLIDHMDAIPPDARVKLHNNALQVMKLSHLKGMVDRGQLDQAEALIKGGGYNDIDPGQMDHVRDNIDVYRRRAAAEAARAQAEAVAQLKQHATDMTKLLDLGEVIPDRQLDVLQADLAAAGEAGKALDISVLQVKQRVNKMLGPSPLPAQIDQQRKTVLARIAKAGDKASVEDRIAADHLENLYAHYSAEYKRDPQLAAARAGVVFQPLDLSDPSSVKARMDAVKAARVKGFGDTPFLSDDEAFTWQRQADTGLAGQMGAMEALRGIPDAAARQRAAQQVQPGDAMFAHVLELDAKYGAAALQGAAALKANPALIRRADKDGVDGADSVFRDEVRQALGQMGSQSIDVIRSTANAIYAGLVARNNGGGDFQPEVYRKAIGMALNAHAPGQRGGIGTWGGYKVALPGAMSNDEYNRRLLDRTGYSGAATSDGRPPHWTNGTAIGWTEFRQNFHPVVMPGGRYGFQANGAGGQLIRQKDGQPWTIDIWKLRPQAVKSPVGPYFRSDGDYGDVVTGMGGAPDPNRKSQFGAGFVGAGGVTKP